MQHLYFVLVLLCWSMTTSGQMRHAIVGTYRGKSAQGMAVWGDDAYLFNDGGGCRVFDLKEGIVTREFQLECAHKNTHVNAACFGTASVEGDTARLIYISEYNLPSSCFVERIGEKSSTLVQTIQIQKNGKGQFVQSWILDNKNGCLYAIARESPEKKGGHSARVKISKYRQPDLAEGANVVLTEKDCMDSFTVEFSNGTQGGKIRGKYLYLVSGLQETAKGAINAERAIQVIDLKKKQLVRSIDLTYVTTNEPEDIDFYHGRALLYAGQNGGIYEVKLK